MAAGQQDRLPPTPRFQENPQQEMQELRAKQKALLEGYGWVNKEAGVARIPIEEAMRMVVERGLPVREARNEDIRRGVRRSADSDRCCSSLRRPSLSRGAPAAEVPPQLQEVGFDQNLDQMLPLDVEFKDEHGRTVRIGDYFGKRPVVLAFVYYGCPMLCLQSLSSLAATLGVLSEDPGKDFEVVSVSIDPRETPALALEKKAHYVERSGKPSIAKGWHYLTGTETNIRRLTKAAGFRYVWDASTQQYAHPAGIVIATPQGRGVPLPVRHRLRPARPAARAARRL